MTSDETAEQPQKSDFLKKMVGTLLLFQLILFFLLFNFQTNIYLLGFGWCMLIPGFILIILSYGSTEPDLCSGIHQYVRYPMYLGWMIVTVGMALISQQWFTIFYAIIIPLILILEIRIDKEIH